MSRRGPKITMASGLVVHPFDFAPDTIRIRDVAHHSMHLSRWGGGCSPGLSVGLHSIFVSRLAMAYFEKEEPSLTKQQVAVVGLIGVLHDAHEVYFGADIPTPVKKQLILKVDPLHNRDESGWLPHGGYASVERWAVEYADCEIRRQLGVAFDFNTPDLLRSAELRATTHVAVEAADRFAAWFEACAFMNNPKTAPYQPGLSDLPTYGDIEDEYVRAVELFETQKSLSKTEYWLDYYQHLFLRATQNADKSQ